MRFIPILLLSFGSLVTTAQVNNQAGWKFLQLPPSPRVAALGGSALGLYTNDYAVALQNPSILQKENNGAAFLENKLKAIIQTYNSQLAKNSFCQCN